MSDNVLRKDGLIIGKNGVKQIKSASLNLANDGKIGHETIHHEEMMDQFVKLIEFCKMDRKMRAVLLLRLIHGYTIEKMQIHLFFHGHMTGNSRDELMMIEEEGKRIMKETLRTHTISEIVGTINAKPSIITGLRNELPTPRFEGLA